MVTLDHERVLVHPAWILCDFQGKHANKRNLFYIIFLPAVWMHQLEFYINPSQMDVVGLDADADADCYSVS